MPLTPYAFCGRVFAATALLTVAVTAAWTAPRQTVPHEGLVVCTSAPACDAGASVLAGGGNAVDAAVATGFALAVTHPAAGNLGGGGFMIIRTPDGTAAAIDYRERAPQAATASMYVTADGTIARQRATVGHLAAGVPGSVRGLALAHRRFGRLPWRDLVMPAVALAEEGFVISPALAGSLNDALERMTPFPASVAAYGKPGGGAWSGGDRLVLPDLARTLRAIALEGPDVFYNGWIADRIAGEMRANGGLMTREDLAAYDAVVRVPIRGWYRGYEILSMPPPSSGGVALVQMLNILEPFALRTRGLLTAPAVHLQIEAMRRAFLDRARHLGDPDFSDIPIERLTSKEYARQVASSIHDARPSDSMDLGRDLVPNAPAREAESTTHYSVLDRDGMAVATTTTLEGSYGSFVVVPGTGFLLNNEMGDFNMKPGYTDTTGNIGSPANVVAPGKRMLSSMTPTIVARDGRVVLVTGSPGGRTIINTVLTVVLGVVEYDLSGRDAVALPRVHHQWLPDRVTVEQTLDASVVEALRAMGHDVATRERQGDAHSIWIDSEGSPHGVPDVRTADSRASSPARLTGSAGGR